ncbi:MAG: class I SAM-dependent methyltransferase [Saprospiraceae bacterium]|nr:class I SAM-dependent methyltransferase [Saprospiraceae bacterium]
MSLNTRIRQFYDRSTPLWLKAWGEHMHHGYYGPQGRESNYHFQAQVDLLEEILRWGHIEKSNRILDAGCGVGGSARFLARRYDARVLGVTLSPVQAKQAQEYSRRAGLEDKLTFEVRDMMQLTSKDGPFDLIWSMESAEHIEDKAAMLQMFYELLSPGGCLLMATWCRREAPPGLSRRDERLLGKIYRYYHLPPMISRERYRGLAEEAGFSRIETDDWTQSVTPFWGAVIHRALQWESLKGLLKSGWSTMKGAWAMRYMRQGYRQGIINYAVIQAHKP